MAFDEDLAQRLREQLAGEDAVTERRMFGGLTFLLHGHMSVTASAQGGLLARVDPASAEALLGAPGVTPMEMNGREMTGWLRVAPSAIADDAALSAWVERSVALVRTLPPKG
ncbi:hypothetical protein DSM112329_04607 [Paraconexibacter sp. AEG42_29]|uniref:TfoX N-terminal domain-containing protein n=1 Tax=Paraconexibacter sp. AEG42_29 TaxID=2997339 RepID=A0AAU7B287_9ACTN